MNRKPISFVSVAVMMAFFVAALVCGALLPTVGLRIVSIVVAVAVLSLYVWLRQKSLGSGKPIYQPIVRQLLKAGYKCGVDADEDICIRMDRVNLFAHVWPTQRKDRNRVHFSAFVDVDRDEISEEGLRYLATQFNARHKYTTVLLREEGLECRVETVVDRTSNVLGELSFAYEHIEQAAHALIQSYPRVAAKYPAKRSTKPRRIGFVPSAAAEENEVES